MSEFQRAEGAKAPTLPSGRRIEQSVSAWQQLRAQLLTDELLEVDERVIAEALAAEDITDPAILLRRAVDACVWAERRAEEARLLSQEYNARWHRYETRGENIRLVIQDLMEAIARKSGESYLAKFRLQPSPESVVAPDVDLLFAKYGERFVRVTKEARKTELKAALKAGEAIEGAYLNNAGAGTTLVIVPKR